MTPEKYNELRVQEEQGKRNLRKRIKRTEGITK